MITATYDLPEGGFEALVQVMVCANQIGWRKKARHIVILATDDYSHLVTAPSVYNVIAFLIQILIVFAFRQAMERFV